MLTILGDRVPEQFCDGVSRRSFLKIGGLAMGGLALPELLMAESQSTVTQPHKAIIMIFLPGGPPHQDMWDLKPEAPSEIRGEFSPIRTNVPGIEICELFPRMAKMMDKFVVIRSIVGSIGHHSSFQCLTGREWDNQPVGGWPCLGSTLSHLQGSVDLAIPPSIGLSPRTGARGWGYNGESGFLAPDHTPFTPNAIGPAFLSANNSQAKVFADTLVLKDVSLDRLRDRQSLLRSFDSLRRGIDRAEVMEKQDAFHKQAFGILTSSRLAEAFDLEKEDTKLRDRYGRGTAKLQSDGAPKLLDQFLLARRLVEAGARCVTLAFSRWDWHGGNFNRGRQDMPMLDQGVTALVQDLHNRGMDQDVSVVVWGEFGRTPKINKSAGRDHWPNVSTALLACGGMRTGQVIGSTDKNAAEAKDRPVHFQDVFATLYRNVGIDTETATVPNLDGRPQHLVESQYKPISEVT